MTDPELPPDLAALERRLADRPRAEPPADLGPRRARRRPGRAPRPPADGRPGGGPGPPLAAAVLRRHQPVDERGRRHRLGPRRRPSTRGRSPRRRTGCGRLAPDLPESELRRQALLARAAAGLTPTVDLNHPHQGA